MIRKFFAAIGIALAMVLPLTALGARNSNLASEMVGTWKLLSYKSISSDGSSVDLYGPAPSGQLIYDSSGHMSVHLLKPNLPRCGTMDRRKCPPTIARIAFDNYFGYWGRYKLSSDGKSVIHQVEGASVPDWVGTSQARYIGLSGNQLTIRTPLLQVGGTASRQVLIFVREE